MLRTDRRTLTWCAGLLLAAGVSVACDDDGGGGVQLGIDVDAEGAAAAVDSVVNSFFEGNEAVGTLDVLGPFILAVTTQPAVASAAGLEPESMQEVGAGLSASLEALRRVAGDGPGLRRAPLVRIPSNLLGVTCIWDPGTGDYVVDPDDPGLAPPNGIRFRIYSIDPTTQLPELPLNDIGFVDITDDSDFSGATAIIDVGLTAVIDAVGTVLDYSVTGDFGETTFSLDMLGAIGDGTDNISFDFSIVGSNTDGSFTASFGMTAGPVDVSLTFNTDATGASGVTAQIIDTATDGVIEFAISFDAQGQVGSGSGVLVNDNLVAVISGNIESASLTRADGSPLTDQELAAIASLFNGLGVLFDAFGDLFILGVGIVGLAII